MTKTLKRQRGAPLLAAGIFLIGAMGAAAQPAPADAPPGSPPPGEMPAMPGMPGFGPPPANPIAQNAYGQAPSKYTPQEAEAVAVTEEWMEAWDQKDLNRVMSLMDRDVQFRADPIEELQFGIVNFCHVAAGVIGGWSGLDLQELYVVGDENETSVLARRIDYFAPGEGGMLDGIHVDVAFHLRIKDGKIIEWLDAPTTPVGPSALAAQGIVMPSFPPRPQVIEDCKFVEEPNWEPTRVEAGRVAYGTNKSEMTWSAEERAGVQAVRAWSYTDGAAKRAQFMDQKLMWRAGPSDLVQHGVQGYLDHFVPAEEENGGTFGASELLEVYPIGGVYDTLILALRTEQGGDPAEWKDYGGQPKATLFRVQKGVITEWYDTQILSTDKSE